MKAQKKKDPRSLGFWKKFQRRWALAGSEYRRILDEVSQHAEALKDPTAWEGESGVPMGWLIESTQGLLFPLKEGNHFVQFKNEQLITGAENKSDEPITYQYQVSGDQLHWKCVSSPQESQALYTNECLMIGERPWVVKLLPKAIYSSILESMRQP
jgi:hypothetical protein